MMTNLCCSLETTREQATGDEVVAMDASITVWLYGGSIGGRIAGVVVERERSVRQEIKHVYRDDFDLLVSLRDAALLEVFKIIGAPAGLSDGAVTSPVDFEELL